MRGAAQAIVDRFADAVRRDWRNRDASGVIRISRVQQVEQPRCGFDQIPRGGERHVALHIAKPDQPLVAFRIYRVQPKRLARRIVAFKLPRRGDRTPPRRRPGPSWGTIVRPVALSYSDLSTWAPAFAGEVA